MECPISKMYSSGPCACPLHAAKPYRPLTILLLECWQRKYDQRPYNTLLLSRILFEGTYHRDLDSDDYSIIEQFLATGRIDNFELNYFPLLSLSATKTTLRRLANLTHVSLCHVNMGPAHLQTLLEEPCLLLSLRLSGNPITQAHADILHEYLLRTDSLAYLDVGYCNIDHVVLATVADGMHKCNTLRAIDMSRVVNCHRAHVTDASKIAVIAAILLWPNQLYEFHGKHLRMDGHDIEPIVECLNRCANLVYLDLGSNRIGADGVRAIFAALAETPHLIGLDISNNNLGESGGLEISNRLAATKLRFLDIGYNDINEHAMKMILLTVKKTVPLRIFNLVGNKFDYEVGKVLRRALDARVLMLNAVDVKTTYDRDEDGFRVVPVASERAQYNYRYMRVHPFLRKYDVAPNLLWHDVNRRKLLVNGLFLDPIFVNNEGRVFTLDRNGRRTQSECTRVYNF